jgi:hypothetical protein
VSRSVTLNHSKRKPVAPHTPSHRRSFIHRQSSLLYKCNFPFLDAGGTLLMSLACMCVQEGNTWRLRYKSQCMCWLHGCDFPFSPTGRSWRRTRLWIRCTAPAPAAALSSTWTNADGQSPPSDAQVHPQESFLPWRCPFFSFWKELADRNSVCHPLYRLPSQTPFMNACCLLLWFPFCLVGRVYSGCKRARKG